MKFSDAIKYRSGPALTGNRCQCPACLDLFNSPSIFDRHRVGDFAKAGELRHERRCLTAREMAARGWSRNGAGFWIERAREPATIRLQGPRMTLPAVGVREVHR